MPIPTSMLFPIPKLIAGSIVPDTVSPKGEAIGLSMAEFEGLILRSWMLPAGLLMRMWLMLIGGAPLLGIVTLPQCWASAREFTRLATGLVSCPEVWCCWAAATMLHICCRRPWATAATAAAAAAPGDTVDSGPLLHELFW